MIFQNSWWGVWFGSVLIVTNISPSIIFQLCFCLKYFLAAASINFLLQVILLEIWLPRIINGQLEPTDDLLFFTLQMVSEILSSQLWFVFLMLSEVPVGEYLMWHISSYLIVYLL